MEEDIELTLKDFLKEHWELTGDLKKTKVLFHRNMRKVEGTLKEPNVITKENVDALKWDKEGMAECLANIVVRTSLQASGTTNKAVDEAKVLKTNMRVEILRILKEETLPTGWEFAHVTRRVNRDNFDFQQPLLGEDLFITIAYQRAG